MKSLNEYITEAIEVEDSRFNNYRVIVLLRHDGLDCASMTEDEFVEVFKADVTKAFDEYDKAIAPENKARIERYKQEQIDKAIAYAEERYKRKSYKDKYIENVKKNMENFNFWTDSLDFFDFDPYQGTRFTHSTLCDIDRKSLNDDNHYRRMYQELKKSQYFNEATGWAFKYEASMDSLRSCFRPWVDLNLSESTRQEIEADKKKLADDIANFYANSNYWGD
jgi:hypothetical protein